MKSNAAWGAVAALKNRTMIMAGGWSRDGAVQEQIDDTINDAVQGARALMPVGPGTEYCDECAQAIPAGRRKILPGVRTCVVCQSARDATISHSSFNRRGNKDSQLR